MIPKHKHVASVVSADVPSDALPERIDRLLADQKREWKTLSDGYSHLRNAKTRVVECGGYAVTLQFNPRRITSTSARTDEESIRSRKCFLCVENLPEEQKGILVKDTFLILCNPAPIFESHLTITHIEHRDQAIEPFIPTMLEFAQWLGNSHTLFYNGPKSGASAPDHMHFQALPVNALPVERDADITGRRRPYRKENSVALSTFNGYGREIVMLESENAPAVGGVLHRLIEAMKMVLGNSDEPLLNILCSYGQGCWKVFVFPRTKHRPAEFYKEGAERLMVSPAAVDMAGFIVTPLEHDFERIVAGTINRVYSQVSPDSTFVKNVLETL